jgi:hypothetical protein
MSFVEVDPPVFYKPSTKNVYIIPFMTIFIIVIIVIAVYLYREWRRVETGTCSRDDHCDNDLVCGVEGKCVICEENADCETNHICTSIGTCIPSL